MKRKGGLKMFFMGAIVLAGFSAAVMVLWNLLIPGIFGLAAINFWQAIGLFILARILFGGFGFGMKGRMMAAHHKNPIHDKWMKMTPEQRREFINKRKEYASGHPFGGSEFFARGGFGGMSDEPKKDNE